MKKPIILWIMISRRISVHCDKPKKMKVYAGGMVVICFIVVGLVALGFLF